jgi:hypothetical protein
MNNIIVAEEEKLRAIVHEEVSKLFRAKHEPKIEIDTITLSGAIALLAEYGYILSKAKLYKLTASGNIPCRKFGQKLVFSRKDILSWAENQTKPKNNQSELLLTLARSARRKKNSVKEKSMKRGRKL